MRALCLPEALPGHVGRTVLPTSPQSFVSSLLPFYKSSPRLTPLESTLTSRYASVNSKRLTPPLLPLESTLTKKPTAAPPFSAPKFVNSLLHPAPPSPTQPVHSLPLYPQSFQTLRHSFRHTGGGVSAHPPNPQVLLSLRLNRLPAEVAHRHSRLPTTRYPYSLPRPARTSRYNSQYACPPHRSRH